MTSAMVSTTDSGSVPVSGTDRSVNRRPRRSVVTRVELPGGEFDADQVREVDIDVHRLRWPAGALR